jgi:ADP-heptose:LPS heptosyltransferase
LEDRPLVVRPGGLGDLVCADIALQELGLRAEDFIWLIEQRSQPWADFRRLSYFCYDVLPLRLLGAVRQRHALVINTEQRFGLAQAAAWMARSPEGRVVSFDTNRAARWSDATIPYDWRDRHETVEFKRLFAQALALPAPDLQRGPRSRIHPADRPPLVLVAGRQAASRDLGLAAWIELIGNWHQDRPFRVAAAPADWTFAEELARKFPSQAERFTGAFPELCEEIGRCEELFTMDGGGVHIASYFGVRTLALFTSGRSAKWHPLGTGSRILRRHDLACQPCTKFGQVPPCPHGFACKKLAGLSPSDCCQPRQAGW